MTINEFLEIFETAHQKYPMRIEHDTPRIRHRPPDTNLSYCPIVAVAHTLADASPSSQDQALPESSLGSRTHEWAAKLGLTKQSARYIIAAADNDTLTFEPDHVAGVAANQTEEIRGRMLQIIMESHK